ncbi:MAG: creatininase family protein, partial [Pseudomonadota bacterium]
MRYDQLARPGLIAAAQAGAVAIVPMAATENHGAHLPLGTDTIIAEALLDGLAVRLQSSAESVTGSGSQVEQATAAASASMQPASLHAVALRPIWLGVSPEHVSFAGTLTTSTAQFMAQLQDICDGLHRAGFTRVILLNAHGGNAAAGRAFAFEQRARTGQLIALWHWLDAGLPAALSSDLTSIDGLTRRDAHAGALETSL